MSLYQGGITGNFLSRWSIEEICMLEKERFVKKIPILAHNHATKYGCQIRTRQSGTESAILYIKKNIQLQKIYI